MVDNSISRIYRRKHFYKVTWERSDKLLKEVPWLKHEPREFCIVGYREPTIAEAQDFIADKMYDRLYDKVIRVEEISRPEALENFQMENWRNQKVFGAEDIIDHKPPLADLIHSAKNKAELSSDRPEVTSREAVPER